MSVIACVMLLGLKVTLALAQARHAFETLVLLEMAHIVV